MNNHTLVKKHVALIMAGGTGGHIFPGLAIANKLQQQGWKIHWLGSKGGMEQTIVSEKGISLFLIAITGLRKKGFVGWFKAPFSLAFAVYQSLKIIKQCQPDVVIGFGGFTSGPGGLAAFLLGKKLFIHEQNAVVGLTNKMLAKLSKKVFQAFPNVIQHKACQTIGNPIRADIKAIDKKEKASEQRAINVLVVGGSRGAMSLNQFLPKIFSPLLQDKKINVYHQCGKENLVETRNYYLNHGIQINKQLKVAEFIDDIGQSYRWADVVICRAGALTVAEISAVGLAAVFVPYPYAVDDHQTLNANWLVERGGAILLPQDELQLPSGENKIAQLLGDVKQINCLAENAKKSAYLNATEIIASACEELVKEAA